MVRESSEKNVDSPINNVEDLWKTTNNVCKHKNVYNVLFHLTYQIDVSVEQVLVDMQLNRCLFSPLKICL